MNYIILRLYRHFSYHLHNALQVVKQGISQQHTKLTTACWVTVYIAVEANSRISFLASAQFQTFSLILRNYAKEMRGTLWKEMGRMKTRTELSQYIFIARTTQKRQKDVGKTRNISPTTRSLRWGPTKFTRSEKHGRMDCVHSWHNFEQMIWGSNVWCWFLKIKKFLILSEANSIFFIFTIWNRFRN